MLPELSQPSELPASLRGWIDVLEVQDGEFFAADLFQRKYGVAPPEYGRHIVALYRDSAAAMHTLSYLHFWQQDRIGLIGGGCTDGAIMRAMPNDRAGAINAAGGMLRQTLLYAFTRFHTGIDAFFGHAGDERAREVDLAAGFKQTHDKHLLIRPVRALADEQEQALIEQALSLGSF
ncbi:MAG: hypothetical protein NXI15_17500 [Gammaproteobacteria bacterium]|nr:hypothetical protein [Gammaproteobacteria bacterium]